MVHYKTVELLVDAGTDLNLKNKHGQTVLDVAREYGKDTTVSYLMLKMQKSRL